ncbi:phospholipase D-like domain-containing protein DpdK [Pantoea ananatis]|uniref:phospholipase D-like domain-containing protein DpdK n=1 Tax=Pantoea ananas TaxID=553 RepID=UPI00049121BE|nr:phospholipase D-like domain-containing protein DpdK [Pantoea ananatis]MDN4128922.1 phospholipase D-like domain-containing protein DpdK [Pantoea ananatis]MDN4153420.1 phospholipase D-like domain-containing protein DpdK [Pantoea ananatis]PQK84235.1 PLD-like domain protein [Pantoea ananatis]
MIDQAKQRQIFLHGSAGQRQLREVLSAQLVALIMQPEPIWLVSPWVSNFRLLDNRSGNWDSIEPAWGGREVDFIELLVCAVNNGASLSLVTRDQPLNRDFVTALKKRLNNHADFRQEWRNQLHTKGLLTPHFFLRGSMNFTWSGVNRNEEFVELNSDPHAIGEALAAFESQYHFGQPQGAF